MSGTTQTGFGLECLPMVVRPPERGTKPKTEVHIHSVVPPMVVRTGESDRAVLDPPLVVRPVGVEEFLACSRSVKTARTARW